MKILRRSCQFKGFAFDVDGVLSHQVVPMFPNGEPMRMANIKDGYVLQLAIKLGYKVAIITGGRSEAVRVRYEALGVQDIFMGQSEKTAAFKEWILKHGLSPSQVMYMGDDMPDIPVMKIVGFTRDAAEKRRRCKVVCRYISPALRKWMCARCHGASASCAKSVGNRPTW